MSLPSHSTAPDLLLARLISIPVFQMYPSPPLGTKGNGVITVYFDESIDVALDLMLDNKVSLQIKIR